MIVKYSCTFDLQKSVKNKQGESPIRMRLYMRGESADIRTGYFATPEQFNSASQCVTKAHPKAFEVNRLLMRWSSEVADTFTRFDVVEKRQPFLWEVVELFREAVGVPAPAYSVNKENRSLADDPFFVVFDRFCISESVQKNWSRATHKRMDSFTATLREFDAAISLFAVTDNKLEEYISFMVERGYKNSTIQKNIGIWRWFLRWAAAHGYYEGHSHETFRPKFKGTDSKGKEIVYLTKEEVKRLHDWEFSDKDKRLELARDVLLFQCFTGLRFSDVQKLGCEDIKREGATWILEIVTQKTSTSLRIELNTHARAILNKYRGADKGRAIPAYALQKTNDLLKEVGRICGIDSPFRRVWFRGAERMEEVVPKYELLTTHVGRRTFVVSALQLGIPAEVIMKWTGHSNFDAMKPYIAIVDGLKAEQMQKFDSFV